ncbi:conjugative transposon protein TraJ [Myroides odoratimimus]|uniref:Conjugal transfer protein n=2 Tax=Myroides odoratimimus TaxID=76832 RepID=A0AAI8C8M9_9FLAO|nr:MULTISPECIES: conjugative transposon protein TraJ [Myroides]ALU27986.1 conjugal transfer protein [Myroides odoratimimus]EHO10261.1 conjugative transposon TraJ protein [Myroides odoratimimus CCUG 10230]MCA4793829.1 conjugative transposon protein TraJ [Myroides odoratimimus]MCA4807599.1 conjugative transposon protein TraJ [Myroides odoratimimus]MCA4821089.1 conjugative transposon protein TraJ [Myroides odoratimimus]
MARDNLHEVLQNLYYDMMPLTSQMVSVAKSLAGLGALFYIGIKVWQALARAEAIDVYPMLRPFALGICIMFFPTLVLGTLNTVLSPVVKGTHQILETQVIDLTSLQKQKDILEKEAMLRNPEAAYLISDEAFDKKLDELGWSPSDLATMTGMYLEKWQYDFQKNLRDAFREILEMIFQASALIIDTIRTFFLIVLSILGPIAFAISIWSGFESTLLQWLTRYISVYLWLPVADLFSAMLARIQSLILERDMLLLSDPSFIPDTSNTIYVIFMIIGIVGYFTIPTVTSWIIQASGGSGFLRNVNQSALKTGNISSAAVGATSGNITGRLIK